MQSLGTLPGSVYSIASGISDDGQVIFGFGAHGDGTGTHGFRWTSGLGMQDVGLFVPQSTDANGLAAVGNIATSGGSRAAQWLEASGISNLGVLPGGTASTGYGISQDGMVIVGTADSFSFPNFFAFRWTSSSGMLSMPILHDAQGANAFATNSDGTIIVGRSYGAAYASHATLWRPESPSPVDLNVHLASFGVNLSGWVLTSAGAISADGRTIAGYGLHSGVFEGWVATLPGCAGELLFRESCDGSWTFGPDGIPGWDHVGLLADCRVYESHPGYGCQYGCMPGDCSGNYWDPQQQMFVYVPQDNGVQWEHTRGSFQHDSTTVTSEAANLSVHVPADAALTMAEFIETQGSAPFLFLCSSSLNISCLRDTLAPDRQKGRIGGAYTCVGLVERAAEEAALNDGEGFIPNRHESFTVPLFGDVPILSPVVLSWFAQRGFHFADDSLHGLFDPLDFVLTDPAGRRLGHTEPLGTLNEIPGALYTGSGALEQFLIPNPITGLYRLRLIGVGETAGAAVGGAIEGLLFEAALASGEAHDITFTIPLSTDANCDGQINNFDIDPFVLALTDPAAYRLTFPDCNRSAADANRDGRVDNFDIDPFIMCLTAGCD